METWIKQIRVKLTGAEEENKADQRGSKDQKILTQKTSSFKDKKKVHNWFPRQLSRKMSHDYDDSLEMEHATAIAAAAFAIYSQEVSEIPQEKGMREPPLSKTRSKVDDPKSPFSQFGGASKRFSLGSFNKPTTSDQSHKGTEDLKKPEKTITPAPSMKRTSTFGEKLKSKIDDKRPETTAPKRTPTFGDKHLMNTDDDEIRPVTPQPKVPPHQPVSLRPPPPPPPPPPSPPPPPIRKTSTSARPNAKETKADAWEREENEKIKERYEKLLETIDAWEKRKKIKARRKLNKHQHSDSERKRAKASRKYQEKMRYIEQIAEGARAGAEERRRNEVFKAKEKANIIRTTGKIPGPCSCF